MFRQVCENSYLHNQLEVNNIVPYSYLLNSTITDVKIIRDEIDYINDALLIETCDKHGFKNGIILTYPLQYIKEYSSLKQNCVYCLSAEYYTTQIEPDVFVCKRCLETRI